MTFFRVTWLMFWLEVSLWRCRRIGRKMQRLHSELTTWRMQRDICVEDMADIAKDRAREIENNETKLRL